MFFCGWNLLVDHRPSCVIKSSGGRTQWSKVLWRSCVILWLWSQNSQAEWARYLVGPHHLTVMTRGCILDYRKSSIKPLPSESKFEISPPSLLSPPLIQNSRIYKTFSVYLAIQPYMLILVWFGIKTESNLCIWAGKLCAESAKYGIKELKSYQICPFHLILWISPPL